MIESLRLLEVLLLTAWVRCLLNLRPFDNLDHRLSLVARHVINKRLVLLSDLVVVGFERLRICLLFLASLFQKSVHIIQLHI